MISDGDTDCDPDSDPDIEDCCANGTQAERDLNHG